MNRLLFFDTETTGLPSNYDAPVSESNNWPRLVQFAYIIGDYNRNVIESSSFIIKPDGYTIPSNATAIHGISTDKALAEGITIEQALVRIQRLLYETDTLVGHNIEYDIKIVDAEFYRYRNYTIMNKMKAICTMKSSYEWCGLPNNKFPKLTELHKMLLGEDYDGVHNASSDVYATFRCFWSLWDREVPLETLKQETQISAFQEVISRLSGTSLPTDCTRIELPFKHMTEFQKILLTMCMSPDDARIRLTSEEKAFYSGAGDLINSQGKPLFLFSMEESVANKRIPILIFREIHCDNPTHFQWVKVNNTKKLVLRVTDGTSLPFIYNYFPQDIIYDIIKIPLSCEERILYNSKAPYSSKNGDMVWLLNMRNDDESEWSVEIRRRSNCVTPTHIKLFWVERERKRLRFFLEHNSDGQPLYPPDDLPF